MDIWRRSERNANGDSDKASPIEPGRLDGTQVSRLLFSKKDGTMSVKNTNSVTAYVANVAEILAAIENLKEFVESLPAPVDGELPNLHYGHVGSVAKIHELIGEASRYADEFWAKN